MSLLMSLASNPHPKKSAPIWFVEMIWFFVLKNVKKDPKHASFKKKVKNKFFNSKFSYFKLNQSNQICNSLSIQFANSKKFDKQFQTNSFVFKKSFAKYLESLDFDPIENLDNMPMQKSNKLQCKSPFKWKFFFLCFKTLDFLGFDLNCNHHLNHLNLYFLFINKLGKNKFFVQKQKKMIFAVLILSATFCCFSNAQTSPVNADYLALDVIPGVDFSKHNFNFWISFFFF